MHRYIISICARTQQQVQVSIYIQIQINNPHNLNTTLKPFSEVKDMFWVSFCCFCFSAPQNGDPFSLGFQSSWDPLWLSAWRRAPPSADAKVTEGTDESQHQSAVGCAHLSFLGEGETRKDFLPQFCLGPLLRATLSKQRKGWSTISRLAGQVFIQRKPIQRLSNLRQAFQFFLGKFPG